MALTADRIEVIIEVGKTRTFAIAHDWPGWCRSGRDEATALQVLIDYGPRYARALQNTQLKFHAPSVISELLLVEQVPGTATTDFGAPDSTLSTDTQPVDPAEFKRLHAVLRAFLKSRNE